MERVKMEAGECGRRYWRQGEFVSEKQGKPTIEEEVRYGEGWEGYVHGTSKRAYAAWDGSVNEM